MTSEMLFDFANIPARERDKLLLSTVIPRPIAWIVSLGLDGQLNAAPFSFFNAFAVGPPVIGIGIGSPIPPGRRTRGAISTIRSSLSLTLFQKIWPGL
jgi:flavin reductase (DIM6/NTAB) family NADH-FMN oxidoreductase RutF